MPNPRPVHFEIHAADLERCKKFYADAFGWTYQSWKGEGFEYTIVMTGTKEELGINGGMVKRMGPPPAEDAPVMGYVNVIGVDNIDTYIAKVEAAGGKVALPKFHTDKVGTMAYYKDTEGNIFGMIQPEMAPM